MSATATTAQPPVQPKSEEELQALRERLTRETIDGVPFYYRGYKRVLAGEAQAEDIMGSSSLQGMVVGAIMLHLGETFFKLGLKDKYAVGTNELGFWLEKRTTLASDVCIFETEAIKDKLDVHYFRQAPKIVIEIDVRVEAEGFDSMSYYLKKTEKLREFGVERILWVATQAKQIVERVDADTIKTYSWAEELELLPGVSLKLADLLAERGFAI